MADQPNRTPDPETIRAAVAVMAWWLEYRLRAALAEQEANR